MPRRVRMHQLGLNFRTHDVRLVHSLLHLDGTTLREEVREHLNRVQRPSGALRVELHAPHLLARILRGLDALDRRVVAVDEERLPASWERILQLERVLVVLTMKTRDHV